jgi:FMN phosphatase YigB (HAD superfamily)
MRAKTVFRRCYCFDLDDTLIKTPAKIHVYRNGVFIKTLTPKQYNFYKKHPNDKLDFSEFIDGEMILKAKKYKIWPVIKNVSNAIKEERSTSDIYILTARDATVKSYIYEFLKQNGIDIDIEHIITIGDSKKHIDIASEKRKILKKLKEQYDEIVIFDDNPQTIQLAASIPGIKTKIVENKNA